VNRLIYSIFSWPFAIGEFACGSLHFNVLKVLIRPKDWIAGIVLLSRASPAIRVMGMSGSIHPRLHLPTTVGVRVGVLAGQGLLLCRRPAPARVAAPSRAITAADLLPPGVGQFAKTNSLESLLPALPFRFAVRVRPICECPYRSLWSRHPIDHPTCHQSTQPA
jgi:hypothetical protein